MSSAYDFDAQTIDGGTVSLADYRGRVLLIVNTASACGFTPQFGGLEALWKDYGGRGLAVFGFPSNEFGKQDPGSNAEIASFSPRRWALPSTAVRTLRSTRPPITTTTVRWT